jgi:hypothetical protein
MANLTSVSGKAAGDSSPATCFCPLPRSSRPSLLVQEKTMQVKPSVFGSATVALALSFAVAALAQGTAPVALTADNMKWSPQGGLALPGLEQVSLVGDPSKPGPYTIRLKFPAGYKLAPHTHPDPREVTILSGTWYTGTASRQIPPCSKPCRPEASTRSPPTFRILSRCAKLWSSK